MSLFGLGRSHFNISKIHGINYYYYFCKPVMAGIHGSDGVKLLVLVSLRPIPHYVTRLNHC